MIISQLGYDTRLPRYSLCRQPVSAAPPGSCMVLDRDETPVCVVHPESAGIAWGDAYWRYDLAALGEGTYRLRYEHAGRERLSEFFTIAPGCFFAGAWQRFHYELNIRFMENELPHGGYMDCGSPLREICSHSETGQMLARCLASPIMDPRTAEVFSRHLQEIARYVRACRIAPGVYAHEAEGGSGPAHNLCREMRLLHDAAYAGLLHIEAWRHFAQTEDLADARACADRLLRELPGERAQRLTPNPNRPENRRYEPWLMYETDPGEPLPREFRTPVLLRTVHLCWRLFEETGERAYREGAATYLEVLRTLQITAGGIYGDFMAWPDLPHRQKMFEDSWEGCFKGCIHGHTLEGLTRVAASDDPLAKVAREMLTAYIDGYFLPLVRRNPFSLPANGIMDDGQPRWFSGMRHAMNGTYALLLAELLRAARVLGRNDLLPDAARIALWFAGVNPGLHEKPEQPWHGVSCHYGRGLHFAKCWTRMPNAVSNGFAVGPQFHLLPIGAPAEDAPLQWHDEDWILHGAAIVDLLTEIESNLQAPT